MVFACVMDFLMNANYLGSTNVTANIMLKVLNVTDARKVINSRNGGREQNSTNLNVNVSCLSIIFCVTKIEVLERMIRLFFLGKH